MGNLGSSTSPSSRRSEAALSRSPLLARIGRTGGALAALAGASLFLVRLAAADRHGQPTLTSATWLVTPLLATGRWLDGFAGSHVLALQIVLASVAAVGLAVQARRGREHLRRSGLPLAAVLTVMGVVSVATGRVGLGLGWSLGGAAVLMAGRATPSTEPRFHGKMWLAVPLGLAVLLRFWSLAQVPAGYAEHAVAHHVEYSIPFYERFLPALISGHWRAVAEFLTMLVHDQHAVNSIPVALGFGLLGVSTTATKLVTAVLGAITVLVAFGVGRRMWDDGLGLLFALLVALSPWHVSISRYGDTEHVLCPLQALLALYFLFGTIRRGRWRDFVLGGLTLGAGWYLYAPSQVMPIVFAAVLLTRVTSERLFLRGDLWKAVAALAVFVAISAPAIADFVHRGRVLPVRSSYEDDASFHVINPAKEWSMAKQELRQAFVAAEDPWFGKPGGGLGALEAALFLPGIAWCVVALRRHPEREAGALILAGLASAFLPGALAPDASFRRLFLFATFALLLAAIVLRHFLGWLAATGASRRWLTVVVGAGVAIATAANAHVYFDLCHLYEAEAHAYHYEMAKFVTSQLGTRFVTIVVARDWDAEDHDRYLALVGYEKLESLARHGPKEARLFRVVTVANAGSVLLHPPTLEGRGAVLAERFLAEAPFEGVDLASLARGACHGCRAVQHHDDRNGNLFTVWQWGPDT